MVCQPFSDFALRFSDRRLPLGFCFLFTLQEKVSGKRPRMFVLAIFAHGDRPRAEIPTASTSTSR